MVRVAGSAEEWVALVTEVGPGVGRAAAVSVVATVVGRVAAVSVGVTGAATAVGWVEDCAARERAPH